MPSISWRHGRKSIFVATEALGGNGSASGSSLIEVSLTGERKRVLVDPTLPARMVRPIASPDGNRLVYSFGKYFHAPVPFALPIRALAPDSGEVETMDQLAGFERGRASGGERGGQTGTITVVAV